MERRINCKVEKDCTLYTLLKTQLGLTKKQISQAKFRKEGILVNGRQKRVTEMVRAGEVVSVCLEEKEVSGKSLPVEGELPEIVYEDEDLIVVNKPAGLVVHPSHGHYTDTLSNRLSYYFHRQGKESKMRSMGRLDKDTSGLVVFAKNQMAAGRLAREKEEGIFTKEYIACVEGNVAQDKERISEKIGPMPGELMKMCVTEEGKEAVTEFEVLDRKEFYTVLRLRLQTGRTHQIRVHMAWYGHPLLGDPLYGHNRYSVKRAALHAEKVHLVQPVTGKELTLTAELPEDMKKIKEDL